MRSRIVKNDKTEIIKTQSLRIRIIIRLIISMMMIVRMIITMIMIKNKNK